jgi:hypothetical protein
MSTQAIGFHLCADGPLRGELHHRGPRFVFDGAMIGQGSGFYSLEEGQYRWHAAIHSPGSRRPIGSLAQPVTMQIMK